MPHPPQAQQLPTLPQQMSPEQREQREFQLTLARTNYNFMHSYLEPVPMSADLPDSEKFSLDFELKVVEVFIPLAENFQKVVMGLLKRELESDLPSPVKEPV